MTAEEFLDPSDLEDKDGIKLASKVLSTAYDGYFAKTDTEKYVDEARDIIANMDAKSCGDIFSTIVHSIAQNDGKQIICEQTPRNVFYIEEILARYPDAKIVNMVRDPRDILLSQKNKWKRRFLGATNIPLSESFRSWANYHPMVTSKIWKSAVEAGRKGEADPRCLTMRFEDIASDPRTNIQAICDHCGLEFEETMLEVERIGSSANKDAVASKGIDSSRVGGWSKGGLSTAEVRICEKNRRHPNRSLQLYPFKPKSLSHWACALDCPSST